MGDADIQGVITCTAGSGAFQQNGGITKLLTAGDVAISGAIDVSGQENWVWQDGIRAPNGAYVNVKATNVTISGAIDANGGSGGGQQYGGNVLLRASEHLAISGTVRALGQESITGRLEIVVDFNSHDFTGADLLPSPAPFPDESNPVDSFDARFGWAVAMDGDRAIVGVPWVDFDRGAVYIYSKAGLESNFAWGKPVKVTCPYEYDYAHGLERQCGYSVDIRGDWAVMGCPTADIGNDNPPDQRKIGVVWVLHLTNRGEGDELDDWVCEKRLTSPDPRTEKTFGHSVDIVRHASLGRGRMHLIVGEPDNDSFGRLGKAHIFRYRPDDYSEPWRAEGTCENLHDNNNPQGLNFGHSVAMVEGEYKAYVGFPGWNSETGAVYTCGFTGTEWRTQWPPLVSYYPQVGAQYGYAIATGIGEKQPGVSDQCLVVGSPFWVRQPDVGNPVSTGLVELECAWLHHQNVSFPWKDPYGEDHPQEGARFGWSVALDNSYLLVGAPGMDRPFREIVNGVPEISYHQEAGAAFVFRYWTPCIDPTCDPWLPCPVVTCPPGAWPWWTHMFTEWSSKPSIGNRFGHSVGVAGDPWGDDESPGNVDAIVGEPYLTPNNWAFHSGAVKFIIDL
ncbi:MAG: FG-GAP repeat protein [bacterium]